MTFLASLRPLFLLLVLSTLLAACDSAPESDEPPPMDTPVPRVVAEADYTVTDTGLKYYDLTIGTGMEEAITGDFVVVHYHGWLTNNQLFDSSYLTGDPFGFTLGTGFVIPGWDEGIAGMRVGGKRQLVIPPDLAYGAAGRGSIPPNSTLIFEVELLSIQ